MIKTKIGLHQGRPYLDLLADTETPSFELVAFIKMTGKLQELVGEQLETKRLDSVDYGNLKTGIRFYFKQDEIL